jgi:hypothetical protein
LGEAQNIQPTGKVLGHVEPDSGPTYYIWDDATGRLVRIDSDGTATPLAFPPDPYDILVGLAIAVELFDPSGTFVAFSSSGVIDYVAASSGMHIVRVLAENRTKGEYVLQVSGATVPPFAVTATEPVDAARLAVQPDTYALHFHHAILVSSLQPGDLLLDGVPLASIPTVVDDKTVMWDLPAGLAEGTHTLTIQPGMIFDSQGTGVDPFSADFVLDFPPRVIASSIHEQEVLREANVWYGATFSEPLLQASIDPSDVRLVGVHTGIHLPSNFTADVSSVRILFEDLPEDVYVVGNFDGHRGNGDEVGLFVGTGFWLDIDHDFRLDRYWKTCLRGVAIAGDFDGDGIDDLGAWKNGVFSFELAVDPG